MCRLLTIADLISTSPSRLTTLQTMATSVESAMIAAIGFMVGVHIITRKVALLYPRDHWLPNVLAVPTILIAACTLFLLGGDRRSMLPARVQPEPIRIHRGVSRRCLRS